MPNIDENEELDFIYEIRVQFDSQVNESVIRMVDIKNVGTTVFYYEWQQKPYTKPFDIVNSKVQRFYFDNRTSNYSLPNLSDRSFVSTNEFYSFQNRFFNVTRFLCVLTVDRTELSFAHASNDRSFFLCLLHRLHSNTPSFIPCA